MRSILFLSDSVNRRFLKLYQESGLFLPNMERLVRCSAVFDNHWAASAPCMPARRDIMTGRINFLERNWGPIEPYDHTLPQVLRSRHITSNIITDHYHYFEIGGENYCQMFDSWQLVRGQEWDPCVTRPESGQIPPHYGKMHPQYWCNRNQFKDYADSYPSAIVMKKAAQWLEENHSRDDFFLWVEPFDPHEPFEVPEEYLKAVGDTYDGPMYMWPEYKTVDAAQIPREALVHVRRRYAALLMMTDYYLGGIFDVMDRYHMWDDTAFFYTTDHGYMLGEHGFMAKNYMPAYNEVFHIPLIAYLPGMNLNGRRVSALTSNIDIMPTLMEYYGISDSACRNKLHGKSLLPLLREETGEIHDGILYGYFGKQVNVTDGHYTYFRAPNEENRPLNLYTGMPTDIRAYFDADKISDFGKVTAGPYLSWTDFPVFRIPVDVVTEKDDKVLRYDRLNDLDGFEMLFNLENDYQQKENLIEKEPDTVRRMEELLTRCLECFDAPDEQYIRLRLEQNRNRAR